MGRSTLRCGCLNVYRAASFKKVVGWRKAWGIAKKKRAVLGRSEKNAEKKAKAYNIDNRTSTQIENHGGILQLRRFRFRINYNGGVLA
jgi:hypothetical protein